MLIFGFTKRALRKPGPTMAGAKLWHLAPPDADELARQVAAGVLRRLDAPSKLLGGATIAAPVAVAPSIMPPPAPETGFSSEKAWILSAAASKFL